MPGYLTKQETIRVAGVDDLKIRSLLDQQQFSDRFGEAARLGISSAAWPMFGLLWPSGAELAARLARRPVRAGERILEIGCGLALASLVAHRQGADVTASDCHPLAASFLLANLRLNHLLPMKYAYGQWGASAQPRQTLTGRYDLIVGSDLLYHRDAQAELASFICRLASESGEVWIVDPDRGNRPAFHRQMSARGFTMTEQRLTRPMIDGAAGYKGRVLIYRRIPLAGSAFCCADHAQA